MSLGVCLTELVVRKQITPERAEAMRQVWDELVGQYEPRFGREAAESMATSKALQSIDDDLLHRKRVALLQAKAQLGARDLVRTNTPEGRPLDPRMAQALIARDDKAPFRSVEAMRDILRGQAHGMIDGILARHRKTLTGAIRHVEDLRDLGRELWSESTGNLNARELADAWRQAGEFLRGAYNAAGGRIAKLEGWALPQTHDARAVRTAGFEVWRDFVVPLLDRAKMLDRETGAPLADGKLELLLRDMWEAISTDGWSRRNPGGHGIGAIANRRAEHRVLHFARADDWLAYAERFGGRGNMFDAMMAHVEGMTRDIAAMRVLGPNPDATVRWLQDAVTKSAMESGDQAAINGVTAGTNQIGRLWDTYTGAATRAENQRLAMNFGTFRNVQTAAKLGGAMLSSASDFGFTMVTAGFNGTPIMRTLGRYLKMLDPASEVEQRRAIRLNLIADEWSNMGAAAQRYTGEEYGHEISRRMADAVLRLSYLSAHTQHLRWANGMEHIAFVTAMRDRAFGGLDPAYQRTLTRYGIGEARWDAIRGTATREEDGADWLFPADIADRQAAEALIDMVQSEVNFAVPVPELRTRALTASLGSDAPEWLRQVSKTAFLFKNFPITVLLQHGRRMLDQPDAWSRARYGLTTVGVLTAMGALSLQLKEVARGRDPREMNDRKFLGAAVLQGGGLGIFGDLLGTDENRFGGGFGQTLLGPGAQTLSNLKALTVDNIIAAMDGDEKTKVNLGRDVSKLVRSEVPGSSLWYTRLAYDRLFADQVQTWIDPSAADAYKRMEKRAAEMGTSYWAPPGSTSGWRSPDFENALGNEAEVTP